MWKRTPGLSGVRLRHGKRWRSRSDPPPCEGLGTVKLPKGRGRILKAEA